MTKRFLVKNSRGVIILATNDRQKAIDEWLWGDGVEVYVFDEQGNHIRTVSQLRDIGFIQ